MNKKTLDLKYFRMIKNLMKSLFLLTNLIENTLTTIIFLSCSQKNEQGPRLSFHHRI